MKLRFHTLDKKLRGILTVKPVKLAVNQILQILHGVFDFGGKQIMGHRPQRLAHIGNQVRIGNHDLIGLLFP